MNKRIINFLMVLVGCGAITGSCKKEDSGVPFTYTSQVVVGSNGSLDNKPANPNTTNQDKYSIVLMFSTDDGASYTEYPKVSPGQKYKVKLHQGVFDQDLITDIDKKIYSPNNAFDFDWSGSKPKPNGSATDNVAEFTLGGNNFTHVNVTDHHCDTNLTEFADGSGWDGEEGTVVKNVSGTKSNIAGSSDISKFTVDPSNANRLWISNFFGDGAAVQAYLDFTTSTSYVDQIVTIPQQTTSEGGSLVGSGTYDQCRQKLVLNVAYSFGSTTYSWTYNFTKLKYCAYDASSWLGLWSGDEGTNTRTCGSSFAGSKDDNNITADPTIANRFHMDNFWGDGVDAYFDINPATDYWSQTVTIPAQTTADPGNIAAGTGVFDQCAGTFQVNCAYTLGTCTYKWTYKFTKK
jgi:hypothetical protein